VANEPYRVVLDTNIMVRGLINVQSDSGRILRACEQRKAIPLLSKEVVSEYRLILSDPTITSKYPELQPE
jgi:predicted nucleic acid-binding protein